MTEESMALLEYVRNLGMDQGDCIWALSLHRSV